MSLFKKNTGDVVNMSLFKKNTGDVVVFQSISYVLLGMDITNLGKRLETVLTHVEDEDFIDIRDEEKLYNKTTKKSVAITFSFDYTQ